MPRGEPGYPCVPPERSPERQARGASPSGTDLHLLRCAGAVSLPDGVTPRPTTDGASTSAWFDELRSAEQLVHERAGRCGDAGRRQADAPATDPARPPAREHREDVSTRLGRSSRSWISRRAASHSAPPRGRSAATGDSALRSKAVRSSGTPGASTMGRAPGSSTALQSRVTLYGSLPVTSSHRIAAAP